MCRSCARESESVGCCSPPPPPPPPGVEATWDGGGGTAGGGCEAWFRTRGGRAGGLGDGRLGGLGPTSVMSVSAASTSCLPLEGAASSAALAHREFIATRLRTEGLGCLRRPVLSCSADPGAAPEQIGR